MKTKFQITLGILTLGTFLQSAELAAASNVLSYPAHLCQQVSGPSNSLQLDESGNLSNGHPDVSLVLSCPVNISKGDIDNLEVQVTVWDTSEASAGIKCQVGQSGIAQGVYGAWGNTATSVASMEIQKLVTSITTDRSTKSVGLKAFLTCLLPAHDYHDAAKLMSYQVTQRFHLLDE